MIAQMFQYAQVDRFRQKEIVLIMISTTRKKAPADFMLFPPQNGLSFEVCDDYLLLLLTGW